MYIEHRLEEISFEDLDVFTGNESASVGTGEVNPWSIQPNRSDS